MTNTQSANRIFVLFFFLASFLGATFVTEQAQANPAVQIASATLNVRNGPGPNFRVVDTLRRGAVLQVVERSRGWLRVSRPNGRVLGWISQDFVVRVR